MLKISVNQRLCIGNGVCAEIAPEVFFLGDDDLAYLCEDPAGCIDIEACVSS